MKRHFVIVTCGTSGDVLPFLEVGKYLLSQNQWVSVITNPYYEAVVRESGLSFVPFGKESQLTDAFADPGLWDPKTGFRVFWSRIIRPNLNSVRMHVESLPSAEEVVILSHPALVGLADLARANRKDAKVVQFYLFPTIIRSLFGRMTLGDAFTLPPNTPKIVRKVLYRILDKVLFDVDIVPQLNEERVKLGMPAIQHLIPYLQSSADLYVTLFPEWYSANRPDYPTPIINGDFVSPCSPTEPLGRELTQFLAAGESPLLFTASTANVPANQLFEDAVHVVERMKTRAIFVSKFRDQLPAELPPNILWQKWAPFNALLPRVSVIVHYGGIGTLAEACKAGVPQLMLPLSFDQFDNASIVRELGIGLSVPIRSLTRKNLFERLSQISHSQSIRDNCAAIARKSRDGQGIDQIVDRVLAAI